MMEEEEEEERRERVACRINSPSLAESLVDFSP
jgi:hypothetical protein